ncbi:MAG: hypothetical protein LUF26_07940 [Firmicutes bacterium]|nr:hypothetical protein [Bacillota bacterium]
MQHGNSLYRRIWCRPFLCVLSGIVDLEHSRKIINDAWGQKVYHAVGITGVWIATRL